LLHPPPPTWTVKKQRILAAVYTQRTTLPKRPARWRFLSLGTLRQRLFHRAGRLIHPGGELTLELNANAAVQAEFTRYLDAMTT
jgi:hypothetical protein